MPVLSKTRFIAGAQCPKLLWHMINAQQVIPPLPVELREKFDRGHAFGNAAKTLYPNGVEVDWSRSFNVGLTQTQALVNQRVPIFEAGFTAGGCHARADVLNPADSDRWDIIEVKNSDSVRPVFILDIAFQRHCYQCAGISVRKCYVITTCEESIESDTNLTYVYNDVTGEVDKIQCGLDEKIRTLSDFATLGTCPPVSVGEQCLSPYTCRMYSVCHG